jgi:hypothetical protein
MNFLSPSHRVLAGLTNNSSHSERDNLKRYPYPRKRQTPTKKTAHSQGIFKNTIQAPARAREKKLEAM